MQVAVYHFYPLLTIFHLFTATGAENGANNGEGIDKLVRYSPKKPFRDLRLEGFSTTRRHAILRCRASHCTLQSLDDDLELLECFHYLSTLYPDWRIFLVQIGAMLPLL